MGIKGILLTLFLYVALVWVGAAYLTPEDFVRRGLFLTTVGLGVVLAAVLLSWLYGLWRAQRAKAAAKPKPASAPRSAVAEHPDDLALRELLREAGARLEESPAFAGRKAREIFAGMPLYLIVGPAGAGKSSVFMNCGLEPQLLAGQARGGKGGPGSTVLANIWLAQNMLFVELGGRHFEGEAERWEQLLRVLMAKPKVSLWERLRQQERPWLEPRGVILVCDTKLFLLQSNLEQTHRETHTSEERLRGVVKVFGRRIPVYTLFAKADQILFFPEYFGRFPEKEADEILGCTLPIRDNGPETDPAVFADAEGKFLSKRYQALYHSLAVRRLSALFHEPVDGRKPNIYEFPREFARIRHSLIHFLLDTFRPNPLHPGPINRGFYFSGRREQSALPSMRDSRMVPAGASDSMAEGAFLSDASRIYQGDATVLFTGTAVEAPQARGGSQPYRWMFLTELFREVILKDQPQGGALVIAKPPDARRTAVLGAAVAVALLLAFGLTYSWFANRDLLGRVREAAEVPVSLAAMQGNLPNLQQLNELDGLRRRVQELRNQERYGAPMGLRWGLYTGASIRDAASAAYFGRLKALLLDNANARIAGDLASLPVNGEQAAAPYRAVANRLKAHIMTGGGGCSPDGPLVSQELRAALVEAGLRETDERYAVAARQVDYYAAELPYGNPAKLALSGDARNHAVAYLSKYTSVDRYYRALLTDVERSGLPAYRLPDLVPDYTRVLAGPPEVAGAFTPAGSEKLKALLKSGKVVGESDPCIASLLTGSAGVVQLNSEAERQFENLYARDYLDAWRRYLGQFSAVAYHGPEDAAQKLAVLAGNRSPLLAVMKLTATGTNFPAQEQPQNKILTWTEKIVPAVRKGEKAAEKGKKLIGQSPSPDASMTLADVTAAFQPVRSVVPPDSERWINDKNAGYTDALDGLREAMLAVARSSKDQPDPQVHQAAQQAYDKALESVRQLSKAFNPEGAGAVDREVVRLLEEPIKGTHAFIIQNTDKVLTGKVEGDLHSFCAAMRPMSGKYPFDLSGADLALKDFSDYFAPGQGRIWKFQAAALAEFTIREGGVWKQNPASQKLKASPELLDFLNRSQEITKAFFPEGSTVPHLTYTVRPHLDENSEQIIKLRIDGQEREFSKNAQLRQQFVWPSPGAQPEAVGRTGTRGFSAPFSSHEGPWALFRMFGDAEARPLRTASVEWKRARGPSGRFEPIEPAVRLDLVELPGGVDVFNPAFFSGYRCPGKATQ